MMNFSPHMKVTIELGMQENHLRFINVLSNYEVLGNRWICSFACNFNPFMFGNGNNRPLNIVAKERKFEDEFANICKNDNMRGKTNQLIQLNIPCNLYMYKNLFFSY